MQHLTPELLLKAYSIGIFPMAESRHARQIHWIDPEKRGVLPLDSVHVPRRLRRTLRAGRYRVTMDQAFSEVVTACAEPGPGRKQTWINGQIERLYAGLFEMGQAHSVECWDEARLVGGLYGVHLGAAFFGESMFSRARDASKVALVHLVARLRKGDFALLDTQFHTDHLAQFGVVEVTRTRYRQMLGAAVRQSAQLPLEFSSEEMEDFLQSLTQTS